MNRRYYKARAMDAVLGRSSKGTEEVAVAFEVLTPDVPERFLTWHGYLSDKALKTTVGGLRAAGWTGDDITDVTSIYGNEVSLVVEDDEYDGKVTPKVLFVNRPGGAQTSQPLDNAKTFAVSLKSKIRAVDALSKAPSVDPRPSPPPRTDADLGF